MHAIRRYSRRTTCDRAGKPQGCSGRARFVVTASTGPSTPAAGQPTPHHPWVRRLPTLTRARRSDELDHGLIAALRACDAKLRPAHRTPVNHDCGVLCVAGFVSREQRPGDRSWSPALEAFHRLVDVVDVVDVVDGDDLDLRGGLAGGRQLEDLCGVVGGAAEGGRGGSPLDVDKELAGASLGVGP